MSTSPAKLNRKSPTANFSRRLKYQPPIEPVSEVQCSELILPRLLSERQLAQEYGLSVSWLRKTRREGGGPKWLKISRLVRYRREDIEIFLAQHAVAHRKGDRQ